jgi:hypothetical protein
MCGFVVGPINPEGDGLAELDAAGPGAGLFIIPAVPTFEEGAFVIVIPRSALIICTRNVSENATAISSPIIARRTAAVIKKFIWRSIV